MPCLTGVFCEVLILLHQSRQGCYRLYVSFISSFCHTLFVVCKVTKSMGKKRIRSGKIHVSFIFLHLCDALRLKKNKKTWSLWYARKSRLKSINPCRSIFLLLYSSSSHLLAPFFHLRTISEGISLDYATPVLSL